MVKFIKGYGNIYFFGSSTRTFEVTVISVVKVSTTCLVSEIFKDKEGQLTRTSLPSSQVGFFPICFKILI